MDEHIVIDNRITNINMKIKKYNGKMEEEKSCNNFQTLLGDP
jgi:hypothetical protein